MTIRVVAKPLQPASPTPGRSGFAAANRSDSGASSRPESAAALEVARFLRSFHVLLRSSRLYQKNHPKILESLEAAERNLRSALAARPEVAVGVEQGRLVLPSLVEYLPAEECRELDALAEDLVRCRVTSLAFLPATNLGELDLLVRSLNAARHGSGGRRGLHPDWSAWPEENNVSGIRVNAPLERKLEGALASLVTALLAYGGEHAAEKPAAITREEIRAALRLLARLNAALEQAQARGPQETARALHAALGEADRRAVTLLVSAMTSRAAAEGESPATYVVRLTDALVLEFAVQELRAGRVAAPELRGLFTEVGCEGASALTRRSDETYAERMVETFWEELPARETATALRGPDAWCVPTAVLRRHLQRLAEAGHDAPAGASPREARLVVLNYARGLESEEPKARRAVAAGLGELCPLLDRLWPNQLPEELGRSVVRALASENSPGIAGLLAAVTENLARLALAKADFAEFERILQGLENAPRNADHAHLAALAARIVADERWLLLVDAALFGGNGRGLDPALPRLLRRDPERLLDRLALILTAPSGLDALPAMARLVRAIGEPALGALEARLYEPRRQRTTAAIKLLAATQPERLVAALSRALPSWDWSLQDLAVSELAHLDAPGAPSAFAATVEEAHPMVVPMMLDQIGLAGETAALPLLLQIAAGEHERLRDIFTRIKAVEALGRMRAVDAAELLRAILRQRHGLTHAEPAGLRAAAEEALALIENRPSSARLRAIHEALEKAGLSFTRPRRYLRIPLASPFAAQIEGPQPGAARVRTISLGGAFLESNRRLAVGDSIRVEIRAGLRRIQGTAVVRNVAPNGGGVEFVHMRQEDREKLRRLVQRLLRT